MTLGGQVLAGLVKVPLWVDFRTLSARGSLNNVKNTLKMPLEVNLVSLIKHLFFADFLNKMECSNSKLKTQIHRQKYQIFLHYFYNY
jgi:hypothetical protein